jgi:DNA gyrase/topoisomerase IV subunit B
MSTTKSKKQYIKMDPIDHIINRPDMYVGSCRLKQSLEFIAREFYYNSIYL